MLHFFFDSAAQKDFYERESPAGGKRSTESFMIDLTEAAVSLHADHTADGYQTTLYLRMISGSLYPAGSDAKNWFDFDATVDAAESNSAKFSLILLQSAHRAEAYLEETGFWARNQRPDPETGGVLFTMDGDKLQVKLVCGADRPEMKGYPITANGELDEAVMCRPYLDEIGSAPLSDFLSEDDEDEDEDDFDLDLDDDDEEEDSLATLPRFICDAATLNQLAASNPSIDQCDPNLTFVMEFADEPVTLLYAPATDEVKKIAQQLHGVVIDADANAYVLFFRRSTFPVSSFSVGMQAYAGLNPVSKDVKGGSSTEKINSYFAAAVSAMLRMNIWLQSGDTYERYKALDRNSSAMLVTATQSGISARVVTGKERPNLQCENLLNMQALFSKDPDVVSARPYLDEISDGWEREMMSLEEKTERAEAGDTDCMEELAMLYTNGDDEVDADPQKAVYWFRKLADAGNSIGMFNLGLFYAKGHGVPRDFHLAADWMRKAEQAGDPDAAELTKLYASMKESEDKARKGDAAAQAALANALMKLGGSLEQAGSGNDFKESVAWAQKSAAQGNADAMWVLALAYHHGRGVKQDMDQAIAYYKKGADLGSADCMHNLGCEYLSGEHVWQNEKKGFELIKRAAEKGNGLAMYNLGRAYQFGNGCIGNMKKALEWYEKAAEVLKDPQIEQRVMAFRSLSQFQPDFDQDYSDEDHDPYDNIPLEGTQYEGRADRCENLRTGTVLQHRISRDKNNQPAIELFHLGGSVGLIPSHKSEKIIEFLKKDRITLKVVVKSCVPKSQRGARARNADVRLTLVIDDKLPGVPAAAPTKAAPTPAQHPANRSQAQDNARKEAERKAQEQQRQKEAEENQRRQEAEAKRRQKEAEEAERKKQEALKAMENSITARRDAEIKRFDDEIRKLTEQKASAEATLASLGFFKFGEKRRQRDIIANTQARLEQAQQEKAKVIPKFDQQLALLKKADQYGITVSGENDMIKVAICDKVLKDYHKHTISEIMEKCPELEEVGTQRIITILRQMTLAGKVERTEEGRKAYFQLEKPFVATAAPRASTSASAPASTSVSRAPTPTQIENDRYKQEILRLLQSGRRYTINEMMAAVPSLGNLSNQRVSAIVRQLTLTGEVIRTEENRIFYFEIGD